MTKTLSAQEIFDRAAGRTLAQGRRSTSRFTRSCAYRGWGGRRCPVGHLIDDAHYSDGFESETVTPAMITDRAGYYERLLADALKASGVPLTREMIDLLFDLQEVHDYVEPKHWAAQFTTVARKYGLDAGVVEVATGVPVPA